VSVWKYKKRNEANVCKQLITGEMTK